MARTTVDIDEPILRDLKRLQRREKKTLGRLVSDLLAEALARHGTSERPPFRWPARRMGALIDIGDKAAMQALQDEEDRERLKR